MSVGKRSAVYFYLDRGYDNDTHLNYAAHGPALVTAMDIEHAWVMSRARIGVEWGFGKIYARCPILKRVLKQKPQEKDVKQLHRVCVLLTNAHTCLHQSQTGLYFNCKAPSLEEYFS